MPVQRAGTGACTLQIRGSPACCSGRATRKPGSSCGPGSLAPGGRVPKNQTLIIRCGVGYSPAARQLLCLSCLLPVVSQVVGAWNPFDQTLIANAFCTSTPAAGRV